MIMGTIPTSEAIDRDVLTSRRTALRDRLEPGTFDMTRWFASGFTLCPADVNVQDCGTTGCVAGHGALEMHARGVLIERRPGDHDRQIEVDGVTHVAEYFGLPILAFFRQRWDDVRLSDGRTLADVRGALSDDDDYRWFDRALDREAVIEYLDDLIKHG